MFKEQIISFKFFLLVGMFCFGSYPASSQIDLGQQVDVELVNFSSLSPVQSELNQLTGWSKQDNGRWLSAANRIPFTDERTNKNTGSERKLGQDNIISLQIRKVMIGNEQYNVLVKKYHDGEYEFPVLGEGWRGYKSLDFYVFKSKKLDDMLPVEIPFNKAYAVDLNLYTRGTVKNFEQKVEDDEIIRAIQSIERGETVNDWNLVFAVFPIKNGEEEVVRFKLIRSFRKKYLVSYYAAPENWVKNFDMTFYETKLFRFKSLVRDAQEFVLEVTNPDNPLAENDAYTNNFNWGILKYQMGDFPAAIEFFDTALEENPDTPDFLIYSFRGNARSKMRLYDDAIDDFDKALDFQPDDVMDYSNWVKNYFNRGVAKYYLHDMTGACKDWNKALEFGFGPAHDYLLNYCQ